MILYFGKHATIKVPSVAKEMVGWLVIGGLLQETSQRGMRTNHWPRTPTWLFAGPTFLSLVQ